MDVTPSQLGFLSQVLDALSMRHRVLAQNVANVNTPGYRRLDVSFEETLGKQFGGSKSAEPAIQVTEASDGPERADGNNVDIDKEMARVTNNSLLYNVFAQVLAGEISTMRSAITGR
jgi:flagellar basal-body rod protein FlgB